MVMRGGVVMRTPSRACVTRREGRRGRGRGRDEDGCEWGRWCAGTVVRGTPSRCWWKDARCTSEGERMNGFKTFERALDGGGDGTMTAATRRVVLLRHVLQPRRSAAWRRRDVSARDAGVRVGF